MNQINSLLTLPLNCDPSAELVSKIFSEDGLRVTRSFDLQSACSAFSDNICQSHGEDPCDCQLVVLLVYDRSQIPISIVLHGHEGRTQLGVLENLGQSAMLKLQKRIQGLLSLENVLHPLKEFVLNAN